MALHLDFGTPVNTALLVYILYSVQRIIFPSTPKVTAIPNEFKAGYSWMPKSHPQTVLFKTYTPKTLAPFDGKNGGRILLAINGVVFDVTAGRNFYGPGKLALVLFACFLSDVLRWDVRKLCWTRCVERNG